MLNNAAAFGKWVRMRRREAGISQRDLAAVVDTGERFIVDLEAGKPTCQLGKALSVASALGIVLVDAGGGRPAPDNDLPDLAGSPAVPP